MAFVSGTRSRAYALPMEALIEVVRGDITHLAADAIVNAANESLLGGGGVDGAIHRRAGPRLLDACKALPQVRPGVRCPTGEARVTPGFDLPARFVIHTVGPVWHGGAHGEAAQLEACYRNSLALARELALEHIAFPAISCGVYAYPPEQAARIAMVCVHDALRAHALPKRVGFCCFSDAMRDTFLAALETARH